MIDKLLKWATPVLLLVLVFHAFSGTGNVLGARSTDNTSRVSALDVTEDISIDDTIIIDGARGLDAASSTVVTTVIGRGNATLEKISCGTAEWNPPSIAQGATTTLDITVTGVDVTGSLNQVYWGGITTTTANSTIHANASSTNVINLVLHGTGGTVNIATTTASACFLQF